jgi:signal transduction histidine kinase
MVVPLTVSGKVFGAISFVSSTPSRQYTKHDLAFATELGRRAALAIENARLYGEVNEANRVKDEFLATLSHELRTPLNVILGRARMLVERSGNADTVQQSADTIERNAHALARLVDDLLDVSRFSAGQLTLDIQRVDIAAVVSTVVASLEPTGRAKGVRVALAQPPALPDLLGDPTRLQQVVWNLLSNAIKFTPSGGTVSLALAHTPTHVMLTVSDTGEGIEPDFLPHVFETFRQAEPTLNRRHGGLGLGLSIVRRLVELHGGYVTADSAGRGQGATFQVALPAAAVGAGT